MISGTSAASDTDGDDGRDDGVRRPPNGPTGPARRLLRGRMNAGSESQAIRWPSSPRNAGSKVIATSTAATTAIAEARPSALTSGMPATPSESRAMTTVQPANTMALPEVATAWAMDSTDRQAVARAAPGAG